MSGNDHPHPPSADTAQRTPTAQPEKATQKTATKQLKPSKLSSFEGFAFWGQRRRRLLGLARVWDSV